VSIDPVNEIQIDDIGLQTLQAVVAAFLNVFGTSVGKARPALQLDIAELAGDHVVAAMPRDRTRDQLLVAAKPGGIGAVEEMDAELTGPPDRRDRGIRVGRG